VADIVDKATRSRMMAAIKGRDTKPEMALRRALWGMGVRGYRCHYRRAPGRPDVCFVGRKVAVFVDGAFWHGHPQYFTFGKSGEKWDAKIRRNMERDAEVDEALAREGWRVVRLWDFEIGADPGAAVEKVLGAMNAHAD
jgi:DNA mismatch endonuclease (patch repair protein)